ncbi:MAG: hypothetical protein JXP34_05800 [Planctomycetes bacterium]|nr:hypothetical protein [Planctomycetota bacterium]
MRRLQIRKDGTIQLPDEIMQALEWYPASYLKIDVQEGKLILEKIAYDPFAEATKKPDLDAFDKIMKKQKDSVRKAAEEFEDMMKKPPEIRPEDRPDFWD